MKFLRNFVWNLIEDQVHDAISEFDEDLDAALFGDEECGIESAIESLVEREISAVELWVEDMFMRVELARLRREAQA